MTAADPVGSYFEGKPEAHAIFRVIADAIAAQGPVEISVVSQIASRRKPKFAWFVVRSRGEARSPWLAGLIKLAYDHETR